MPFVVLLHLHSGELGAKRGKVSELFPNSALQDILPCSMVKVLQFPFYSEIFIVQLSHSNGDLMVNKIVLPFSVHLVLD